MFRCRSAIQLTWLLYAAPLMILCLALDKSFTFLCFHFWTAVVQSFPIAHGDCKELEVVHVIG